MTLHEQANASGPAEPGEERVFKAGTGIGKQYGTFRWDACPGCGTARWVPVSRAGRRCARCNARRSAGLRRQKEK